MDEREGFKTRFWVDAEKEGLSRGVVIGHSSTCLDLFYSFHLLRVFLFWLFL